MKKFTSLSTMRNASMNKFFSANQVAKLLKTSPGTILRWTRLDLIISVLFDSLSESEKHLHYKNGIKPEHVYTFTSIVQAKILQSISLQANVHAGTIKKSLDFLKTIGETACVSPGLCLVRLNNNLLWIKKDDFGDLMRAIIVMGKKRGQYEFTPMVILDDALNELRHSVEVSNLEDYNKTAFIHYLDDLRKAA